MPGLAHEALDLNIGTANCRRIQSASPPDAKSAHAHNPNEAIAEEL